MQPYPRARSAPERQRSGRGFANEGSQQGLACRVYGHRGRRSARSQTTSPISAYKTAEAHWTKTFRWEIEKTVSPASWKTRGRESGASTYTVKVDEELASEAIWVDGNVCGRERLDDPDREPEGGRPPAGAGRGRRHHPRLRSLDMSINPVLDRARSSAARTRSRSRRSKAHVRNNARVIVTNDPRTWVRRWGRTRRSTSRCRHSGGQRLRERGRHERDVLALRTPGRRPVRRRSGATRTKGRTTTRRPSVRPARATTRVTVTCKPPPSGRVHATRATGRRTRSTPRAVRRTWA